MPNSFNTSDGIIVSVGNSTTEPLGAGGVFVGDTENAASFNEISINLAGAPSVAPASLYFEFSPDGTHWDVSVWVGGASISGPGAIPPQYLRVVLPYFRIRYENGSTPLTELRLTTIFHRSAAMRLTRYLNQEITDTEGVENVHAVVMGKQPNGAYINSPQGGPVAANTTSTPLTGSEQFVGDWIRTTGYSSIGLLIQSDQLSAPDGIIIEHSDTDGGTIRNAVSASFTSDDVATSTHSMYRKLENRSDYARVRYQNGVTPQSLFFLEMRLNIGSTQEPSGQFSDDLPGVTFGPSVNAVIRKEDPSGNFVTVSAADPLPVTGSVTSKLIDNAGNIADFVTVDGQTHVQAQIHRDPYPRNSESDAFSRLRVSESYTLFESKQLFGSGTLYFSSYTSGSATMAYQPNKASTLLTVTAASGSRAVRQSKRYFNYQPGKSQYIVMTFTPDGGVAGIDERVGYYDDSNGIFFQLHGTTPQFVVRSKTSGAPIDVAVSQADWNIDSLDGSGPSGLTMDFTKSQILFMDFQWLGVGTVRYGFVVDARLIYAHASQHANVTSGVYMSTPNLPVRWECVNTSGSATTGSLESICCTVISEGGFQPVGLTRTVMTDYLGRQVTNVPTAVMAFRLQTSSSNAGAALIPKTVSMATETASHIVKWELLLNPTLGGPDAWNAVANSSLEYSITKTTVTGGSVVAGGFIAHETNQINALLDQALSLGRAYNGSGTGTEDILALVCSNDDTVNSVVMHTAMTWLESTR